MPQFPKYKDKIKGRFTLCYTYIQVRFFDQFINFPKKEGIPNLRTKVLTEKIKQIRIVPQNSCYIIEIVYSCQEKIREVNSRFLSIDLGLNNLGTITTSENTIPIILNGRPLKSINQYYNKKLAKLKSSLEKNHQRKFSNKTNFLTLKRNNKIADYMHKSSKSVINYCLQNNIDNIVVGKNEGWKQEINIGKRNNQNFVQIPFESFISKLSYKAQKEGISFKTREEAYTSKCSALDLEDIKKHNIYLGKRIKRGLFQTFDKTTINADVNGSLNILRKEVGNDFMIKLDRGLVVSPVKVNFH